MGQMIGIIAQSRTTHLSPHVSLSLSLFFSVCTCASVCVYLEITSEGPAGTKVQIKRDFKRRGKKDKKRTQAVQLEFLAVSSMSLLWLAYASLSPPIFVAISRRKVITLCYSQGQAAGAIKDEEQKIRKRNGEREREMCVCIDRCYARPVLLASTTQARFSLYFLSSSFSSLLSLVSPRFFLTALNDAVRQLVFVAVCRVGGGAMAGDEAESEGGRVALPQGEVLEYGLLVWAKYDIYRPWPARVSHLSSLTTWHLRRK